MRASEEAEHEAEGGPDAPLPGGEERGGAVEPRPSGGGGAGAGAGEAPGGEGEREEAEEHPEEEVEGGGGLPAGVSVAGDADGVREVGPGGGGGWRVENEEEGRGEGEVGADLGDVHWRTRGGQGGGLGSGVFSRCEIERGMEPGGMDVGTQAAERGKGEAPSERLGRGGRGARGGSPTGARRALRRVGGCARRGSWTTRLPAGAAPAEERTSSERSR